MPSTADILRSQIDANTQNKRVANRLLDILDSTGALDLAFTKQELTVLGQALQFYMEEKDRIINVKKGTLNTLFSR